MEQPSSYLTARMSLEKKSSISSDYIIQYHQIAEKLRQVLLDLAESQEKHHFDIVKQIFHQIDENDSGIITAKEMMSFLRLPELHLFEDDEEKDDGGEGSYRKEEEQQDPEKIERFCNLILEQIDEDGNGTISLEELATFIFPEDFNVPMEYEPGIVYDLARRELVKTVSNVSGSEDQLLQEFANLVQANVRNGYLEQEAAKKAFMNLYIPHFSRVLDESEADLILRKLDADQHGRISAKAFKQWLYPDSGNEEKRKQAHYLQGIVINRFNDNPRGLFNALKSEGEECIYKPDFVTNIKRIDPKLSRKEAQDLYTSVSGGEKSISYSDIVNFLGYGDANEKQEGPLTPMYHQNSVTTTPTITSPQPLMSPVLFDSPDRQQQQQQHQYPEISSGKPSSLHTKSQSFTRTASFQNRGMLEKKSSLSVYASQYNYIAKQLREALLRESTRGGGGDDASNSPSHYEIVKEAFRIVDNNDSGVVTAKEMISFLKLPQLRLFEEDPQNMEKFCQLILEQIDENGDGTISLEELATFIFPEDFHQEGFEYEAGILYEFARKVLVEKISPVAGGSDEIILQEFANVGKVSVRKDHIEDRAVKKALVNLYIPQFSRTLREDEADLIVRKLDVDHHGRISAKAFKQWLFPAKNYEERIKQATYLYGIIKNRFRDNPRELFETFKSYGAECIYKPDFITHIKGVDPNLSRQDAQELCNSLCGGEKSITYPNILDFLGYCEEFELRADYPVPEQVKEATSFVTTTTGIAITQRSLSMSESSPASPREVEENPTTPSLKRQHAGVLYVQPLAIPSMDDDNVSAITSTVSSPRNSGGLATPLRKDHTKTTITSSSSFIRTPNMKKGNLSSRSVQFDSTPQQPQLHRIGSITTTTPQQHPVGNDSYARKYNKFAQDLREALLRLSSDRGMYHIDIVKEVFRRIDDNDSGVLTSQEMLTFLKLPELHLFDEESSSSSQNAEKFCQLLLEQIDENGDGTISLEELATFIFPEDFHHHPQPMEYESGIIYDLTRKALVQKVSGAAAQGSDDLILQEFANLAKATIRKGHLEDRAAKKALLNLFIPQFSRNLQEMEVDLIMNKLDVDHHGRISAKAFKQWLFPVNNVNEKTRQADYLYEVIKERFFSNPRQLYESFKSYGAECIYKADFITNIKAIDSSLSRQDAQDLANGLSAGEKFITFGNIVDFLGYCKQYEQDKEEMHHHHIALNQEGNNNEQHQQQPHSKEHHPQQPIHRSTSEEEEEEEMEDIRHEIEIAQRKARDSFTKVNTSKTGGGGGGVGANQSMLEDIARRYALSSASTDGNSVGDSGARPITDTASLFSAGSHNTSPPSSSKHFHPSNTVAPIDASSTATGVSSSRGSNLSRKTSHQQQPVEIPKIIITEEERAHVKRLLSSPPQSSEETLTPLQRSASFRRAQSQMIPSDENTNTAPSNSTATTTAPMTKQPSSSSPRHIFDFAKSQTIGDAAFPLTESTTASLNPKKKKEKIQYGAVGYSAKELTQFGFVHHAGRWRGFPYDSFSCCDTSSFYCPKASSSSSSSSALKNNRSKAKNKNHRMNTNTLSASESLTLYLEKKMKIEEKRSKSPRAFFPSGSHASKGYHESPLTRASFSSNDMMTAGTSLSASSLRLAKSASSSAVLAPSSSSFSSPNRISRDKIQNRKKTKLNQTSNLIDLSTLFDEMGQVEMLK